MACFKGLLWAILTMIPSIIVAAIPGGVDPVVPLLFGGCLCLLVGVCVTLAHAGARGVAAILAACGILVYMTGFVYSLSPDAGMPQQYAFMHLAHLLALLVLVGYATKTVIDARPRD